VPSNKARGYCCRTSCRPSSPIAAEACSPAVFTCMLVHRERAGSRRPGAGLAPGPQALPAAATALVLYQRFLCQLPLCTRHPVPTESIQCLPLGAMSLRRMTGSPPIPNAVIQLTNTHACARKNSVSFDCRSYFYILEESFLAVLVKELVFVGPSRRDGPSPRRC
jgi:hypothetical protein